MHYALLVVKPHTYPRVTDAEYVDTLMTSYRDSGWFDYYKLKGRFEDIKSPYTSDKFYSLANREGVVSLREVWNGFHWLVDPEWEDNFEKEVSRSKLQKDTFLIVDYHN